ncbi:unnamed protein product [Clonostachys rosea]|uniref:Uncharacterized protein n=1 Tax=Bionectria ochroleuca TaxID=29856 RepID=A0ABY6UU96_BIOOC|nr:unnamed protein product [Clonostachys rosea]
MDSSETRELKKEINAKNTGPGSQYIADGRGDQNIVTDQGVIYNDYRRIHRNISQWIKSQLKFAPLDARQIHRDLKYQKEKNTGSWILDHKIFQEWQNIENSSQILALEGINMA